MSLDPREQRRLSWHVLGQETDNVDEPMASRRVPRAASEGARAALQADSKPFPQSFTCNASGTAPCDADDMPMMTNIKGIRWPNMNDPRDVYQLFGSSDSSDDERSTRP